MAETGDVINIPDAYADDRFDQSHDAATGFRTRSILCAPVRDGNDKVIGVIQAINSTRGAFNAVDCEMIVILAAQVSQVKWLQRV